MNRTGVVVLGGVMVWGAAMLGSVWNLTTKDTTFSRAEWNNSWATSPERIERIRYEQKQVECLAQNVFHEARGSSEDDMLAVALVTINRVNHKAWGGTVCDVVYEKAQFSWTLDRKLWDVQREPDSWVKAQQIAAKVYFGSVPDFTDGATHYFNAAKVLPSWAQAGRNVRKIGQHTYMQMSTGGR